MEEIKHSLPYLKTFRKDLRKHLTPAEAALWELLKNNKLEGRKFRRQHSVNNFILDFYCASEKIIIELDGDGHNHPDKIDEDIKRDQELANAGFKVLRFENNFVFNHREQVLGDIRACFTNK